MDNLKQLIFSSYWTHCKILPVGTVFNKNIQAIIIIVIIIIVVISTCVYVCLRVSLYLHRTRAATNNKNRNRTIFLITYFWTSMACIGNTNSQLIPFYMISRFSIQFFVRSIQNISEHAVYSNLDIYEWGVAKKSYLLCLRNLNWFRENHSEFKLSS